MIHINMQKTASLMRHLRMTRKICFIKKKCRFRKNLFQQNFFFLKFQVENWLEIAHERYYTLLKSNKPKLDEIVAFQTKELVVYKDLLAPNLTLTLFI